MKAFISALHKVENVLLAVPLVIVMVMTLANVFMRYVLGMGILWLEEFLGVNMVLSIMIAVAAATSQRGHTAFDSIACMFPRRVQTVLYFFVNTIVIAFQIICVYSTLKFAGISSGQYTAIMRIPMAVFYWIIAVGFGLSAIEQIICVIEDIRSKNCRFIPIDEQILGSEAVEN